MLVNPPYSWDPERRNTVGATALDLAARNHNAYLPVVWPLAMATPRAFEYLPESPTLTALLLLPPPSPLTLAKVSSLRNLAILKRFL